LVVNGPTLKSRQLRDVCLLEQSHDYSEVASAAQRSPLSQDEVTVSFSQINGPFPHTPNILTINTHYSSKGRDVKQLQLAIRSQQACWGLVSSGPNTKTRCLSWWCCCRCNLQLPLHGETSVSALSLVLARASPSPQMDFRLSRAPHWLSLTFDKEH